MKPSPCWSCGLLLACCLQQPASASQAAASIRYPDAGPLFLRSEGRSVIGADSSGVPLWTYTPQAAAASTPCPGEAFPTLLLEDANGDGVIDAAAGERARVIAAANWQQAGQQHAALLALDVSRPGPPRVLWVRDETALTRLARPVAAPAVARITIGTANRDPGHYVVLIGAGLPVAATSSQAARDGIALLALDATDGRLLWLGAGAGTADQRFPTLDAAVAGGITPVDLNADGYADRLYVGDWNASLWRLDVSSGNKAAGLMRAGRIAALADPADPGARGFIAAPDVALFAAAGAAPWLNIAIGSVATRRGAANQNLFVLRDRQAFRPLTQALLDALTPVTANELPVATDATAQPLDPGAAGYRIPLGGNQILARALTVNGVLLFTQASGLALPTDGCTADSLRVVVQASAVAAIDGRTALDLNADGQLDTRDRAVLLPPGTPARSGVELTLPAEAAALPGCRVGDTALAACPILQRLRRSYWRREDAD